MTTRRDDADGDGDGDGGPVDFFFEDSELPDLVLETIIGFLAAVTPTEHWGTAICAVSKRWRRIARPVLREAFLVAWPKFLLPATHVTTGTDTIGADLMFNARLNRVTSSQTQYCWALTQPLPLRMVAATGRPVGVVFRLSVSSSCCVGAMLVDDMAAPPDVFLDRPLVFSPFSAEPIVRAVRPHVVSAALIGACSGDIIEHHMDGRKCDVGSMRSLGLCTNWPYEVVYTPGTGQVSFAVTTAPGHVTTGAAQVEEAAMLKTFGQTASLVFIIGLASTTVIATLLPRCSITLT
jgi:hypothetical protein